MYLQSIRLYNFRNLRDCQIDLTDGPIILVGKNGNGKTNLVEAISFLSCSKSLRSAATEEMIKHHCSEASVFGVVISGEEKYEIGISIFKNKKSGYVDGNLISPFSSYLGRLIAVTFTPNDLGLIQSGPQLRRSFLDKHLVDIHPQSINSLLQYRRAVSHKMALLRQSIVSPQELEPWNHIIAEHGAEIYRQRLTLVQSLENVANEIHRSFGASDGKITLLLKSAKNIDRYVSTEAFFDYLNQHRDREIDSRSVLFGPHRDDLLILLNGREAAAFASQGQTRSIVLSLKLAIITLIEERVKSTPVVLLDDLNSELDSDRSRLLFDFLFQTNRQVFITGTSEPSATVKKFKYHRFSLENGAVTRLD